MPHAVSFLWTITEKIGGVKNLQNKIIHIKALTVNKKLWEQYIHVRNRLKKYMYYRNTKGGLSFLSLIAVKN